MILKRLNLGSWLIRLVIGVGFLFYLYQLVEFLANPWLLSGVEYGGVIFRIWFAVVITPANLLIGILIIRRVPGNPIGLLLLVYAISLTSVWNRADVDTVGVRERYLIIQYTIGTLTNMVFGCLLYYFPTGKVYPQRATHWVNGAAVLSWIGSFLQLLATDDLTKTHRELLQFTTDMTNPFYVPALGRYLDLIRLTIGIGSVLWIVFLIGGIVSIVFRYRNGNDEERQKIKWLMWFSIVGISSFPIWIITGQISETALNLWAVFFFMWFYPLPVFAIGIAILRHRLYDIDIIIRRTLVYAILTTILGVIYFGGIVLIQRVFQLVTGQNSEVAIVISTLLIVAIFTPLRRGVQAWIDRRFYRRKYDAEQTIAKFNETLRDEVDLETLKANLIGVVQETLQPSSIRLWVKE